MLKYINGKTINKYHIDFNNEFLLFLNFITKKKIELK